MNLSVCSNITQEEIAYVHNLNIKSSLTVTGGTAKTNIQVVNSRSAEVIERFMREGQTQPSIIEYTLVPIWEYLQEKTIGTPDLVKAVNMEYFYNGFLSFDCPYVSKNGMNLQMFDLTGQAKPEYPEYSCTIAPSGCHSDDDCHYHVGIWCNCAGNTCIHYDTVTTATGKTRLRAAPYKGSDWGWNGWDWKPWHAASECSCRNPSFERKTIWSQSSKYALYVASILSNKQKQERAETRDEL